MQSLYMDKTNALYQLSSIFWLFICHIFTLIDYSQILRVANKLFRLFSELLWSLKSCVSKLKYSETVRETC